MKTFIKSLFSVGTLCVLLIGPHVAIAGVSAEEAENLKTTLTPLGAERAGNAEGTIPAWEGGYTTPHPGEDLILDLFPDDKPLFSITAQNMEQYADKLTDGVKFMFQKYPETFRIDVYQTRRTAAAPQWVYDNTFKNATRGKLDGHKPIGVYGGIPFPIPQSGAEAMWNHQLIWRGNSYIRDAKAYLVTAAGKRVLMQDDEIKSQFPYYYPDGSAEDFAGNYLMEMAINSGPPIRTGEGIMGLPHFDKSKYATYVYLTGQRRVRKLPDGCCDTPTPFSSGQVTFDEIDVFVGGTLSMDRFDWKILGKKEIYIPYNTNMMYAPKIEELLGDHHLNPDYVRWELHRVWVVECTLREGKRHTSPRSVYYLDEDTWGAVLGDRWDADEQLWRTLIRSLYLVPNLPALQTGTWGYYDLLGGGYYLAGLFNEEVTPLRIVPRFPDHVFSPASLAGRGIR